MSRTRFGALSVCYSIVANAHTALLSLLLLDMKRIELIGKTRRVLLVDDNKNGTPARKAALEEQGYETGSASSPAEALELFQQTEFDLVVTDYRMPKMNGTELIEARNNES